MGSGGNAAGSGATPAGAVACTYGPQFIEGKPTGAQGRPRPEHRKRRGSTARSASGSRYREQRTVAGNGTGRQLGSRVRAHGKPCGRCRGGDMSTPQNVRLPGITCGRLQITAVRRGGRVDAALGACRTGLRIYVATTAGDPGRPAGVPGCRPPMTGTARPREVRPQRMGFDKRAGDPGV